MGHLINGYATAEGFAFIGYNFHRDFLPPHNVFEEMTATVIGIRAAMLRTVDNGIDNADSFVGTWSGVSLDTIEIDPGGLYKPVGFAELKRQNSISTGHQTAGAGGNHIQIIKMYFRSGTDFPTQLRGGHDHGFARCQFAVDIGNRALFFLCHAPDVFLSIRFNTNIVDWLIS